MTNIRDILNRYKKLPQFEDVDLQKADQLGMDEESPLHMACYQGHTEEVREMISSGIDINVRGDIGSTPLHEAVLGGHAEVIKVLLNNGASLDSKNDYGETPLELAETQGNQDVITALTNKGKTRENK